MRARKWVGAGLRGWAGPRLGVWIGVLAVVGGLAVPGFAAVPGAGVAAGRASAAAQRADCTGPAAVEHVIYHITGPGGTKTVATLKRHVRWDDDVTADFTVPARCAPLKLTLASYHSYLPLHVRHAQMLFDHDTATLGAGRHRLTVSVPAFPGPTDPNHGQVDFATGPVEKVSPHYLPKRLLIAAAVVGPPGHVRCLVVNERSGQIYHHHLQPAVDAAHPGDMLSVRGTCTGHNTIGKSLTIIGGGPSPTLDGRSRGGRFVSGSVLTITTGVMVTVSNLTITDGRAPALGGGINNSGTLTLNDGTTITGNRAPSQGGGINNSTGGTVTLDHSTITDNTANNGGGIYNFGAVTLNDATSINHNTATSGGGIFNVGTVTLHDSGTITDNTVSSSSGGGIFNLGSVNGNRGHVFGNRPNDIFPSSAPPSPASAGGSSTSASTTNRCSPGAPGLGFYNGKVCIGTTRLPDGRFEMVDPARPGLSCGDEEKPFTQRNNSWGTGKPANLKTACVDAMYAAATQWDMLRAWLGRNGFDGQGHAARIEVGSPKPESIFSNSPPVVTVGYVCRREGRVGCAEPDALGRQKSSMDIIGHEFGHMVFETTPGGLHLDIFENWALSEGTGDIFAQLTTGFANNPRVPLKYQIGWQYGPPARIMYHPSLGGAPNCWSTDLEERSNGEGGRGSGPLNHWFYLLAEGSHPTGLPASPTCNHSTLTGLGIQLAGKIFYNGLLHKTDTWKYRDARSATLTAAIQLFPGSCTVFDKVKAAWNAVSVPARADDPTCTHPRHT